MDGTATGAALERLPGVGLDEVTADADLQTRKDRKYLVDAATVGRMVGHLLAESAADVRVLAIDDRRAFRYASVYFDTPELTSYLGAARRRPRRFKVRTRSYLDSRLCFLEVKTRDGRGRTVKHRQRHDFGDRERLTHAGRRFVGGIDPARPYVGRLRATLTTEYVRVTLVLPGVPARVTIDTDLAFGAPGRDGLSLGGLALVETKTAGPPCPADRFLWQYAGRPVAISKYCTGLAAVRPELPANKWNRVLRRHFGWIPRPAGDPGEPRSQEVPSHAGGACQVGRQR